MNKNFTVQVTCQDEGTKAKYEALAVKMNNDAEFKSKLGMCTNEEAVYKLYNDRGYTDLSFKDFVVQFRDTISQIITAQNAGSFELSEDELENVVGGFDFDFFSVITSTINVIPIAGPLITGVAKAIKAGVDGKGAEAIVANIAVGIGGALCDSVIMAATGGLGTGAAMLTKVAVSGAIKACMNEGLKAAM